MSSSPNKPLFREPSTIDSLNELELARKRAEVNATQDRLRLQASLKDLKTGGPKVLLREVVLPAAVVGLAVWGVAKAVQSLTSTDREFSNAEEGALPLQHPPVASPQASHLNHKPSTTRRLATYLPLALKLAKMGVGYLEDSGKTVPPLVHTLLSMSPGDSASSTTQSEKPLS